MDAARRILKYTVQHITRNLWQSTLLVLVLSMTMLTGQAFTLGAIASDQVLTYLENQPQVLVFFKDEASAEQLIQMKTELEKDELIESVGYISKEQAVEIYKDLHKNEPELLEFVTPDILPASLEISGNDINYLSAVAVQFQENQFVERVIFQRDLVDEVLGLTNALRTVGMVAVGVLAVITAMIILVVVAQNISSFSREIEIMRLVGAGSTHIALPFLLDSAFFAFKSATIASVGTWYLLLPVNRFVNMFIAPVGDFVSPEWFDVSRGLTLPHHLLIIFDLWIWTLGVGLIFTVVVTIAIIWRKIRL